MGSGRPSIAKCRWGHVLAAALLGAAPVNAQAPDGDERVVELGPAPDGDGRAVEMIQAASAYLGLGHPLSHCGAVTMRDEIIVCGHRAPDPRYEPVAAYRPPDSKSIALGAPPVGHGVGASVSVRGCFLQKCPKDFYIIDLDSIPEAAPGSDADKISRGEMRGR